MKPIIDKPILYIKGSTINDVRLRKFINYFVINSISVSFIGWDRNGENSNIAGVKSNYIHRNGCTSKKQTIFNYVIWMIKLFVKLIFTKNLKQYNIIAINFDSCLPLFLVSWIRNINYYYEIYDEFALSYNFPSKLKILIKRLDSKMISRATKVIHVDSNRCNSNHNNSIIIENTPNDFLLGKERDYSKLEKTFAVIGYFSSSRGLDQIYKFALENQDLKFLLVGVFANNDENEKNFNKLNNVIKYNYMPQEQLFKLMLPCCAIFSLYNPVLEINKFAASNKVYDSMMLGIPVITNKEVSNSKIISKKRIGIIVDFQYNKTWDILKDKNLLKNCKELGNNGRQLFLKEYVFNELVSKRLVPELD